MIKTQELRLGNLLQIQEGGIKSYPIEWFHLDPDNEAINHSQPIPLTEEWLANFGFKCVHEKNKHYAIIYHQPGNYMIHVFHMNTKWCIAFSDDISGKVQDYSPRTEFQYVHQLQNLHFAITGEELKLR